MARRNAATASIDFTLGIDAAGKCEQRFERVAANRTTQRFHQTVRGAVGKENPAGSLQQAALSLPAISPAAEAISIQYSRSTIGTVIGLKSNGE